MMSEEYPEPEVEDEKKKKKVKQVLDGGRLLGVIARSDPELYEQLKLEAEKNGAPPHEIIITYLKKYMFISQAQAAGLTVEQLLLAWDVLERMLRFSMWLHTTLATTFFSEMTQAYAKMIDERVKQYTQALEEREKKAKGSDVVGRLFDMLMPLLEGQMRQFMTAWMKASGQPIPPEFKMSVPVNLKIKEEERNSDGETAV